MTAPNELLTLPPELAFFVQEVSNRLLALSPAEQRDAFIAAVCVTAELTLEIRERSPELMAKFIRRYRAQFRGLH